MNQLGFCRPTSLEDAAEFLAFNPGSRIVCGGSNLIDKWKNGMMPEFTHLVDLGVRPVAYTMHSIVHHAVITKRFPVLVQAADMIGTLQISTMATLRR